MMDNELIFGEAQDVTGGATVDSSDNVYIPQVEDGKNNNENDRPNVSTNLCLNVVVEDEDLLAGSSNRTCSIKLYADSDDTNITTDGDMVLQFDFTVNSGTSNYPDGTRICSLPLPVNQLKPYLQAQFAESNNDISTGKLTWWIGPPHQIH